MGRDTDFFAEEIMRRFKTDANLREQVFRLTLRAAKAETREDQLREAFAAESKRILEGQAREDAGTNPGCQYCKHHATDYPAEGNCVGCGGIAEHPHYEAAKPELADPPPLSHDELWAYVDQRIAELNADVGEALGISRAKSSGEAEGPAFCGTCGSPVGGIHAAECTEPKDEIERLLRGAVGKLVDSPCPVCGANQGERHPESCWLLDAWDWVLTSRMKAEPKDTAEAARPIEDRIGEYLYELACGHTGRWLQLDQRTRDCWKQEVPKIRAMLLEPKP